MKTVLTTLAIGVFAGILYFSWWSFFSKPNETYCSANRQIAEYAAQHKLPQNDQRGVAFGEARVMVRKGTGAFWVYVSITRFGRQMDFRTKPGMELEHFLDFLLIYEAGQQKAAANESFSLRSNNSIAYYKFSGPFTTEEYEFVEWDRWADHNNQYTYIAWLLNGKKKK